MSRLTTIPSGTLAKLGFFFLLIALSDILKSQRHLRQHLHFSKFITLTQVKFKHLNISLLCKFASYLDSETYSWDYFLRRCCLLILGFWTGIAGALYNMDWNLEFEVVSITVPIETLVQNRFFLRSRETRFENLKTTHRVDLDKPKAG